MSKWRDVKQNRAEKYVSKKVLHSPLNFVSIAKRFKAFLTDTFLITTPILYIVIYLVMGSGQEFSENRSLGWGIIFTIHFVIIAIFWLINGQTPGLKAYDLKLVDNKTDAKVSVLQTIIRYSATLFSIISIFFIFTPFVNKEKKTFQDIVSNTKIIEK
ncbi:hypothetical protein AN286_03395 [Aliarcobacter cryaerophilus ATCC 43158]|uniref:RDD family membrane protein n=1 Tax=Aliarcobacter cryaerophilus ATCC 43158 TaxID=1032070 RepID=A0AAD0TQV1_9BACT|nr:RDD family protein [Aliarcobacter cryaerophilus]AYJ79231.1 RDD family membrane protein [Aliarcobacter cryaerophilus ATCC 43158]PRM96828.1 hypothetical protein CJ667_07100 [Aliarcobacter cryaerophilus]QCZ23495.1 hypothetical protein AN286_03395 [Aliarcobacter cryaerophilus ATCC 43158]